MRDLRSTVFTVASKRFLNDSVVMMEIAAPHIAAKAKPGQFIIFRIDEDGERIPLTIAGTNKETGNVMIIAQIVGKSTRLLSEKNVGDTIADFVGPLGKASELDDYAGKKVAVIGGGLGAAIAWPQAKRLHEIGAKVDIIAGYRNKDLVILEDEMRECSDNLYVTTDDGSNGVKGFVSDILQQRIDEGIQYDLVIAVGPLIMMKVVSELTKKYDIPTIVSMNTIMIDGTGMCGGCRLSVDGETKFACVDGPDFDGHLVNFEEAMRRGKMYHRAERDQFEAICNLTGEKEHKKLPRPNMSLEKVPMPTQDPAERQTNFLEVEQGYTPPMAMEEASRCLNCKHRPCVKGCPVMVNIPDFINQVYLGDFEKAYELITDTNGLPAVCGRVCPQEVQCEELCVRGFKGQPVAIGRLERFVADWHMDHAEDQTFDIEKNGHKVAIIGSGPAGLTCAGDLAKMGYEVTVFEALHVTGGVLMYGIPEFRLPKKLVQKEISMLKRLGVDIRTNMVVGRVNSLDELLSEGYEAIFIGSGAGLPSFLHIPGENLNAVYSANEFLTRINLMKAYQFPHVDTPVFVGEHVAVIGGGNVAMDAARSAKRLGAKTVTVVYRRAKEDMPARIEEVAHAGEEGIEFKNLYNPVSIQGNDEGWVTGLIIQKMGQGEPDESGRRRPVPLEGTEEELPVDTVIIAIGQSPNPLLRDTTPDLETHFWGGIIVDEETMATSKPGVFAGGDAVTGAATVIQAMGAGKTAAASIDRYIKANEDASA
ncbi:MAG TPA: NADPH-dependent glutamate synthase [Fastidiosipila sp.]|nr:NADPH-dependent glutamate synthase [Fastidiosipila sp.]